MQMLVANWTKKKKRKAKKVADATLLERKSQKLLVVKSAQKIFWKAASCLLPSINPFQVIKNRFSAESVHIAALAKALAHPARVEILLYLAKHHSCICGDIVSALPLSQATVSQHLAELKAAGLVQGTIDGVKVYYCLSPEGIATANRLLCKTLDLLYRSSANTAAACC